MSLLWLQYLFCIVKDTNKFLKKHLYHLLTPNELSRLLEEPTAYGKLGLANLLELREECLREFQFIDTYRSIKQR